MNIGKNGVICVARAGAIQSRCRPIPLRGRACKPLCWSASPSGFQFDLVAYTMPVERVHCACQDGGRCALPPMANNFWRPPSKKISHLHSPALRLSIGDAATYVLHAGKNGTSL